MQGVRAHTESKRLRRQQHEQRGVEQGAGKVQRAGSRQGLAPPQHGERHQHRQLHNEVAVMQGRRETEHHAQPPRRTLIRKRVTPAQTAIHGREYEHVFDVVMVEHADPMQLAGQAREGEAHAGHDLQRERQAQLSCAADHEGGADGDRYGRDEIEHRQRLQLGEQRQHALGQGGDEHVVGPRLGHPAAFRRVDARIELQQMPGRGQGRQYAPRVVEGIVIGRNIDPVD